MKTFTKPFKMLFLDKTAKGGFSEIKFDPMFDRVPSTREFVTTARLARKYAREVFACENGFIS